MTLVCRWTRLEVEPLEADMVTHDCKQSIIRLAVLLIAVFVLVGRGARRAGSAGVLCPEVFVFPSGERAALDL